MEAGADEGVAEDVVGVEIMVKAERVVASVRKGVTGNAVTTMTALETTPVLLTVLCALGMVKAGHMTEIVAEEGVDVVVDMAKEMSVLVAASLTIKAEMLEGEIQWPFELGLEIF